ncbi:MAG: class I tRNA ligase family protein, partial [Patescibacteria group bacterium]
MTEQKPEKSAIAKREEEILKFWQEKKIFEKSLEGKSEDFVFYDGPPYATGTPHYGHLLASTLKDAIPRYQTMRGKRVLRRWGWDCHGLPIENLIEKELGLKTKKDIENLGIAKFNEKARESVLRYADEWQKVIPRLGRFVDMERDYKTMDSSFMESGWWVFKTLWDKGLVYEGYKSMHLCPRCGTTLANFEVNLGYKDITDISVYVKFELVDEPGTYLLAWTTTPWTLPGNAALAVNPKVMYVKIQNLKGKDESQNSKFYILAKEQLTTIFKEEEFVVAEEFIGEKLIGKKYKSVFDYYLTEGEVFGADFVTTEDGTGIVHIAPAFGEDDMKLGEANKLPFIQHVDAEGKMKAEVKDFAGLEVKPKDDHQRTDILIIKYLAAKNLLFEKKKIVHPYPHCWRCETPLLNYAASSWFIKVTELKERMLKHNAGIKWVPEHMRDGRFGKWLEGARDWAVSRSRFWGTPLPVWRKASGELVVLGSVEDLKKYTKKSGNKYFVMRHGEADSNTQNIVSGKVTDNFHLTTKGKEQVAEVVGKLKNLGITKIFYSDFYRTEETAELVVRSLGLSGELVQKDERLREINSGDFSGKPIAEYRNSFSSTLEKFTKTPANGENLSEVKKRVISFLYELEQKFQNEKILLITHEYPTWMLFTGTAGLTNEVSAKLKDEKEDFIKNSEVRELPFVPLPHNENFELDLHRPYIDDLELVDEAGEKLVRVPEVFDVWFDSGSMPYGQAHYPFENKEWFEHNFPADFIGEGLDQTRGWFYVLTVLAAALFDKPAFQNVIVNGLILAEDGQKMSKRLKNYPEIEPTLDKYGADALRLY